MNVIEDQFIWSEKYRPQTVKDCILPPRIKKVFQSYADEGQLPHLLLTGTAGTGKTTIAKALCEEIGANVLLINASKDGNIDTLRTTIQRFASGGSLSRGLRVVILDEADGLNAQSFQPALRAFMQEFSKTCRFILTANYSNRLIEPLRSRCTTVDFTFTKEESAKLAGQFMKRCTSILDNEDVKYESKAVAEVIMKCFPDFRKTLDILHEYSVGGTIDMGAVSQIANVDIKEVVGYLKKKEFTKMRKWCAEHSDIDTVSIMRQIIGQSVDIFQSSFIPNGILIMNRYDYQNAFVTDKEINLVSFFTELMMDGEFK